MRNGDSLSYWFSLAIANTRHVLRVGAGNLDQVLEASLAICQDAHHWTLEVGAELKLESSLSHMGVGISTSLNRTTKNACPYQKVFLMQHYCNASFGDKAWTSLILCESFTRQINKISIFSKLLFLWVV